MSVVASSTSPPWTCPFCALLCDGYRAVPSADGATYRLEGSSCPRAGAALARFSPAPAEVSPLVDGQPTDLATAIDAAARRLAASRQPLFGGLGTDVDGARALYALASRTGAICDPAAGPVLAQGLRALQDRGAFTTTLAEIRTRADLVLCVGGLPSGRYPELLSRIGVGADGQAGAPVIALGATENAAAVPAGALLEHVPLEGDLFDSLALLAAQVARRPLPASTVGSGAAAAIVALAERLRSARYAVLVYEPARWPQHGALLIEVLHRIVAVLNRETRAAAFPLAGDDGSATVNQVFAWLSGLPLRSRAGPAGLEHEPFTFDAGRLLEGGSVDFLLWLAAFGTEPPAPKTAVPRVVVGHPALGEALRGAAGAQAVYIPVSTPGIGAPGHLFRCDGTVLLPLHALRPDPLPGADDVLRRLLATLETLR